MKEKIKDIWITFRNVIWPDPVWSKVIAAAIIALGAGIFSLAWGIVNSIYENIPFRSGLAQVYYHLIEKSEIVIPNYFLYTCLVFIAFIFIKFITRFIQDILLKIKTEGSEKIVQKESEVKLRKIRDHSTVFFTARLADAFPGQRGLTWYDDPKTVVNRLMILLKEPLTFDGEVDHPGDPVWWFRGGSALFIDKFSKLSKSKILLGFDELEIKRIAVNIDRSYYKSYVYVEAKAEKPTGLYTSGKDTIKSYVESFGYAWEEYAIMGKKLLKREEYDDGSFVHRGKIVKIENAELRCKYWTEYNFIIAAKQSPYNSQKFSGQSKEYFNGILQSTVSHVDFFTFLENFEKYER